MTPAPISAGAMTRTADGWTFWPRKLDGRFAIWDRTAVKSPHPPLPFPVDTDLLIVMLGTNDLLQGKSPEQVAKALEQFLAGISLERSKILLIAPPPMTPGAWAPSQQLIDDSRAFSGLCQALAERLSVRFADAGRWNIPLAYDGVHFTEQGHRVFAAGLLELLES